MAKQYKYTLYRESGVVSSWVQDKMKLEELQEQVGGYIEMPPRDFWTEIPNARANVYIDEEGKMKGKKPNQHFKATSWGDYLAGNVLVEEVAK